MGEGASLSYVIPVEDPDCYADSSYVRQALSESSVYEPY
jgi:hypothetical protein